jgi:ASC-1-like (ASCH) protein
MNIKETKRSIIQAGHKAVEELIKVAKEAIIDSGDDITADRLKNAAATKSLQYSTRLKYSIGYKKKKICLKARHLMKK